MRRSEVTSVLCFYCAFLLYLCGGLAFLLLIASGYLKNADLNDPLMFADALVYRDYCSKYLETYSFLFFKSLGPCLQSLFTPNYYAVYFFNSLALFLVCSHFCQAFRINKYIFIFFMFANPMTFFSLMAPNKEVFGAMALMLILTYQLQGGLGRLLLAVLFCVLSRYSIVAVLFFIILSGPAYKLLVKKFEAPRAIGIYFTGVVVAISTIYVAVASSVIPLLLGGVLTASEDISTADRISRSFNSFAQHGGLFFAIILRALLGLFSPAYSLGSINLASNGLYYSLASAGSALCFIVVIPLVFYSLKSVSRLINSDNFYTLVFAILAFSVIHGISPTIQNRYWYPIFPLLLALPLLTRFARARFNTRFDND